MSCTIENVLVTTLNGILVPGGGLEPPHCYQRRILNPLRLPIPPSRQGAERERAQRQKAGIIPQPDGPPQGWRRL